MARKKKPPVQNDLFGHPLEDGRDRESTAILPLDFESQPVRVIMVKGEPWWILSDLARILSYRDANHASRELRANQQGYAPVCTLGGTQQMKIASEGGLYRLIMRSDGVNADRFQDWVTDDILPTIRRTGTYSIGKRDRVGMMAKKLHSDRTTAKVRCDLVDANKTNNLRLASEKVPRRGFADFHNAAYRGQFNQEAPQLRLALGLSPRQTPLNRMGVVPLATQNHAKIIVDRFVKESPTPISNAEQCRMVETIAAEMASADLKRLGEGWGYAIVEDRSRGTILDVMKRLPPGQSVELAIAQ